MSRIQFSLGMKQDNGSRRPSVSVRTTNASGYQMSTYNIGEVLTTGRSNKKLTEKDRCEFNVNLSKRNQGVSFVLNTTQTVPHVNWSLDHAITSLIPRSSSTSRGLDSHRNPHNSNDHLRRRNTEPSRPRHNNHNNNYNYNNNSLPAPTASRTTSPSAARPANTPQYQQAQRSLRSAQLDRLLAEMDEPEYDRRRPRRASDAHSDRQEYRRPRVGSGSETGFGRYGGDDCGDRSPRADERYRKGRESGRGSASQRSCSAVPVQRSRYRD